MRRGGRRLGYFGRQRALPAPRHDSHEFALRGLHGASNRAVGHVEQDGQWMQSPLLRNPDAQSPAGGASSSVNDMAKWLAMMLGKGVYAGHRVIDAQALESAISPQMLIAPAHDGRPASYYGFGFNVGTTAVWPSRVQPLGCVRLGRSHVLQGRALYRDRIRCAHQWLSTGIPETLGAQFFDLVEVGSIQRDWYSIFNPYFVEDLKPEGSLVGVPRPQIRRRLAP